MNQKQLLILVAVGAGAIILFRNKKEKYTAEELKKIEKYKSYLSDKDLMVIDKKKYKKLNKKNRIGIQSVAKYYAIAKTIAKYVL